jgi:hypothetical protein
MNEQAWLNLLGEVAEDGRLSLEAKGYILCQYVISVLRYPDCDLDTKTRLLTDWNRRYPIDTLKALEQEIYLRGHE